MQIENRKRTGEPSVFYNAIADEEFDRGQAKKEAGAGNQDDLWPRWWLTCVPRILSRSSFCAKDQENGSSNPDERGQSKGVMGRGGGREERRYCRQKRAD